MNSSQLENQGILDSLRNAVQPESVVEKLGIDKQLLIDIGLYGSIGFIAGFLLKKYSEYFICFVLFVVGLIVLQQCDYISLSVNMAKIQYVLGVESMLFESGAYGSFVMEWIKSNVPSSLSLLVGFLIGLKVG
jgi:uncharacterized membrane protein (Fun14 family)